jgi:hypothetical protein
MLYLSIAYGPAPLTAQEIAKHRHDKAKLDGLCRGAKPVSEWTPVSDGIPDDDTVVLIAIDDGGEPVWLGYISEGVWHCVDGIDLPSPPTHWRLLPEHPAGLGKAVTHA